MWEAEEAKSVMRKSMKSEASLASPLFKAAISRRERERKAQWWEACEASKAREMLLLLYMFAEALSYEI